MMQEYRGLSRTGRAITSSVNAGLALSTYDDQKKRLMTKYEREVTNMWHSNNALVTIDNYNHYYNSASLQPIGSRETQFIICNWTVAALSRFEVPPSKGFGFVTARGGYLDSFPSSLKDLSYFFQKVCLFF